METGAQEQVLQEKSENIYVGQQSGTEFPFQTSSSHERQASYPQHASILALMNRYRQKQNKTKNKKNKSSASKPDWGPWSSRCIAASLNHSARDGSREGMDVRPLGAGPGPPRQ